MTQVIMANSFRGGTGKSTILSNIASYLSTYGMKVMIIDADIISPGIHAIFGLEEKNFSTTLTDYMKGISSIEEAVYDISETMDLPENMLYLVPSSINKADITEMLNEKINYEMLSKGIPKLIKGFNPDYILIDTHPGINKSVMLTSGMADMVFNIVRPDNQDYQGIKVYSEIMNNLKLNSYIILNKVHAKLKNKKLQKEIESKYNIPVAGMLPMSDDIVLSQSGFIMSDRYPEHEFSKGIQDIGSKVFDIKPKEHIEVIYEILSHVRKQKTCTSDFKKIKKIPLNRVNDYLSDMKKDKYISSKEDIYCITDKGNQFLKKYDVIRRFISDFRL